MSFSARVLVGLLAGLATGLFLGEIVAPLKIVADGFIKLLQMTVLPYVTISIIVSLGSLDAAQARRLGARMGMVLALLWAVALGFALLFPVVFPARENASFFSTTLVERRAPFDFIGLYIPSNPFRSLADGIVPAVVLFSIVLGVALIGLPRKQVLLDVLSVANALVSRATRFVVQLTPYGMFAIAASVAGTMSVDQINHVQGYLVAYVAVALLLALWVLPGLVSAFTPIGYGELLAATRNALITAFMAGDLFIVLPSLTEACKELLSRHRLTDDHTRGLPEVVVPASFNFPHTGKLLSASFILFAGWFADASVPLADYPLLALTTFLTFFGSLNAAVPFLLDLFRIPADTFQLYLATGVINARFGSLLASLHTVVVALLASAAITGHLRLNARRLTRYVVVTTLLTVATFGGLRLTFSTALRQEYTGADLVYAMRPVFEPVPATVVRSVPPPSDAAAAQGVMETIRARGALRVCVLPDRLPYAFDDRAGNLIGFDVEMAHRLGHDLGVGLEFVRVGDLDHLTGALEGGACDLAMAGVPVTPQRASTLLFSAPYLDETFGFIVRDDLRAAFSTWEQIRTLKNVRIGAYDIPYYLSVLRDRAPSLDVNVIDSQVGVEAILRYDAFLMPAERGSVMTLLHPKFTVVVPEPDPIRVPLAYPLARHDERWAAFVNTWIDLKRRDGTIDRLYRHWILGRDAVERHPRWSVVRDLLHWVE